MSIVKPPPLCLAEALEGSAHQCLGLLTCQGTGLQQGPWWCPLGAPLSGSFSAGHFQLFLSLP